MRDFYILCIKFMEEKYSELKDSLSLINEIQETPLNFEIMKEQRKEIEKLISERERNIEIAGHEILIINDNPEIDFDSYLKRIEHVLNKISEIHPTIIKLIKKINLSDEGRKEIQDAEVEEKIKQGKYNGPNGKRYYDEITLKARAFKDIDPRYIYDNKEIKSENPVNHFEFILSHECFHELNYLSQFQKSTKVGDVPEEDKNFIWMNQCKNEKSLDFNGFLNSKGYGNLIDENDEILERFKNVFEIKMIKNNEGENIRCLYNKENGNLIPKESILFSEKMLTNYTRNESKNNSEEDFCDAMVLYTFDPDFLKQFDELHGTKKFKFLEERWGFYSKKSDNFSPPKK